MFVKLFGKVTNWMIYTITTFLHQSTACTSVTSVNSQLVEFARILLKDRISLQILLDRCFQCNHPFWVLEMSRRIHLSIVSAHTKCSIWFRHKNTRRPPITLTWLNKVIVQQLQNLLSKILQFHGIHSIWMLFNWC